MDDRERLASEPLDTVLLTQGEMLLTPGAAYGSTGLEP
jgi:hypothetical protein